MPLKSTESPSEEHRITMPDPDMPEMIELYQAQREVQGRAAPAGAWPGPPSAWQC